MIVSCHKQAITWACLLLLVYVSHFHHKKLVYRSVQISAWIHVIASLPLQFGSRIQFSSCCLSICSCIFYLRNLVEKFNVKLLLKYMVLHLSLLQSGKDSIFKSQSDLTLLASSRCIASNFFFWSNVSPNIIPFPVNCFSFQTYWSHRNCGLPYPQTVWFSFNIAFKNTTICRYVSL